MSDFGSSDIEDEEMAAAIAASLAEAARPKRGDEGSHRDADEEKRFQDELQRAIEASKADSSRASSTTAKAEQVAPSETTSREGSVPLPEGSKPTLSDFLRQRAQLEKERLERSRGIVNVRTTTTISGKKRSITDSHSDEDEDSDDPRPAKRQSRQQPSDMNIERQSQTVTEEYFYDHELRQTANRLTEKDDILRGVKTFRISEIIGDKTTISFAILSSYSTDISWLYSFFMPETPVILVNQPTESGDAQVKSILPNWIMAMPFLRAGRGAMHVKLMLIFYTSGRLRLAIPTANFIDYDWRDIENTVWVQDFPPKTKPTMGRDANANTFASTLQMVLTKMNVPAALRSMLIEHPNLPLQSVDSIGKSWSFEKVKVKLIPSMAGKYEGWDQVLKQGHVSLMKAIVDFGGHSGQAKRANRLNSTELIVECQGSSIGTYSAQWLQEMYSTFSGISPEKWLDKSKASRAKLPTPPIRILFPSLQTVRDSVLGFEGGGTMFCRESQWNSSTFPRQLFHDSNSKRGKVLMHTKMILGLWVTKSPSRTLGVPLSGNRSNPIDIVEIDDDSDSDEEVQIVEPNAAGWLYVGSHNFTPSAWGNLSGSSFTPIINIVNYELGVLIPLSDDPQKAEEEANGLVSWKRPPRKYDLGRGDIAWCQS
ncbi:phospholipase D/nuclease [Serendipita vermifera]|nr:phospholipase D/nuclease [Serendipita vermifera]